MLGNEWSEDRVSQLKQVTLKQLKKDGKLGWLSATDVFN